jgi:hypothetical protein
VAKLAKILKTEMSGDMKALASLLQSKGRGKDTILAHITPAEAKRLKKAGGRGSRNPDTGLLEFDDAPAPTPDVQTLPETTVSAPAAPVSDTYAPISVPTTQAAPVDSVSTPQYVAAPSPSATSNTPTGSDFGAYATQGITGVPPALAAPDQVTAAPAPDQTQDQTPKTTPDKSLMDRLGLTGKDLARLGITGIGGLAGVLQSRKAAGQIGAAQQQQQALATPYQEQGRALTQAAASGALSPASAQAYQAARAQMEQQASQRGGVGAEQMATQLENFRQQLLQQQYTYGLQIAQIGDQISLGAIQTGLQLDQQLQQASQNFYTSLAAIAAGTPIKG